MDFVIREPRPYITQAKDWFNSGKEEEAEEYITFSCGGDTVLMLDAKGMTYKGQRIEDAGEAHRAFLETIKALRAATA